MLIPASGREAVLCAVAVAEGLIVAVALARGDAVLVGVGLVDVKGVGDTLGLGEAEPEAIATGDALAVDSSVALRVKTNGSHAKELPVAIDGSV